MVYKSPKCISRLETSETNNLNDNEKIYSNVMGSRHINMWRYTIITIIALTCYVNTLFGSFVFDDTEAIVKNKDVLPSTDIYNVFKNDFWGTDISLNSSHKSYRPITILTYRLNVMFSDPKLDAFHFHVTNILLYIILCLLIIPTYNILIMRKRKLKCDTAFLSSLLFTVHPLHTEVVSGLVGRADIMGSMLSVTSLLLYRKVIRRNNLVLYIFVNFLIAVAVLCKETAITTFGLCFVYDIFYRKFHVKKSQTFLYRNLGLLVSGFTILYFRFWIMNFEGPVFSKVDNPAAFSDDVLSRALTYNYIYFLNILLMLWPQWLCFDWSMGCVSLLETICDIRIIFVSLLWIFVVLTGYKLLKSFINDKMSSSMVLAISLMIFPFIPASNMFLKVGFVIAERTLLLPSAGFCLLIVLGFKKLITDCGFNKNIMYACFYILCITFAIRTIRRNFEWLDEESLFTSALDVCPSNAKVHYNIAKIAADKGDYKLALEEYGKAIELNPHYEQAMNNLANLLREDKKFVDAEVLLRKALQIRPNFAAAWMNLGIVLTNLNQQEEAEECYIKAISYRSRYPDCYYNLGNLYLDLKRNDEALKAWEKAVTYRPTHTAAWSNTLVLLDSLHQYEEVLELGRTALMHNPKSPALHFSIANTLGKLQQFERAEKHFLEALNFNSYNALYYSNLGVLYHRWGKSKKAQDMYRKALQIDPSMKTTENNLKKLLNAQQNITQ